MDMLKLKLVFQMCSSFHILKISVFQRLVAKDGRVNLTGGTLLLHFYRKCTLEITFKILDL